MLMKQVVKIQIAFNLHHNALIKIQKALRNESSILEISWVDIGRRIGLKANILWSDLRCTHRWSG